LKCRKCETGTIRQYGSEEFAKANHDVVAGVFTCDECGYDDKYFATKQRLAMNGHIWGNSFKEVQDRIVQQENVGDYFISTVRLPHDMIELGYSYETMIRVDDEWTDYQVRCNTIEEARIEHNNAKQWVMRCDVS